MKNILLDSSSNSLFVRTICIILMILLITVWSIKNIEFGDDSSPIQQSFTIILKHFGRDPEEIEKSITIPLESKLRNVRGIQNISSRSEYGSANLTLLMKDDFNFETAYLDIRDAVYGIYSQLPSSAQKPQIFSGNNSQQPAIIFSIDSSVFTDLELQNIAERNIKPSLEKIKEAGEIQIGGGCLEEVLICVNKEKTANLGITPQSIGEVINESYVHGSIDNIKNTDKNYSLLFSGRLNSINEIGAINITTENGQFFPISALATIEKRPKDFETISRLNGSQKLIFYIKSSGRGSIIA
ncbi:MAG: efflux RND transporter permease subunit, partial [Spirochaetales bacterium]|nr:efflux RND transporter permease subunit [Spirochaetales bacterium]